MDTNDIYEAFGIDPENPEGVNEQNSAESAIDSEATGANEQDAAEPAGSEVESSGTQQSPEDNARFAAARRQAEAERDAAIAQARRDADAEIESIFKAAGMVNPYTKAPIRSRAEFDEYRKRFDEEQTHRIQSASGLDDQKFAEAVEKLPQVKAAREAEAAAQQVLRSAQQREAQLAAEQGIRDIQKLDPTIKSVDDLTKMPEYPQFYEYVRKGLSFEDAYTLTHRETVQSNTAAAARQAAYNAQSKSHLTQTAQRGTAGTEIPADVLAIYRQMNPGASLKDIQAHWARNHTKG